MLNMSANQQSRHIDHAGVVKRKPGQTKRQFKVEQIENSPFFIALREGLVEPPKRRRIRR